MAATYLAAAFPDGPPAGLAVHGPASGALAGRADHGPARPSNAPLTSSAGAAVRRGWRRCSGCATSSATRARPAIELEQLADVTEAGRVRTRRGPAPGRCGFPGPAWSAAGPRPTWRPGSARRRSRAGSTTAVAAAIEQALRDRGRPARGWTPWRCRAGCSRNLLLTERVTARLAGRGLRVLVHRRVPCKRRRDQPGPGRRGRSAPWRRAGRRVRRPGGGRGSAGGGRGRAGRRVRRGRASGEALLRAGPGCGGAASRTSPAGPRLSWPTGCKSSASGVTLRRPEAYSRTSKFHVREQVHLVEQDQVGLAETCAGT